MIIRQKYNRFLS